MVTENIISIKNMESIAIHMSKILKNKRKICAFVFLYDHYSRDWSFCMKCKSRFFFLGAVLTALVIFIFSSFNGDESVKQSNAIREPLVKILSEVYSVETTTVGAKVENYTEITTLSQNLKSKNTLTRRQWSKVLKYSAEVIRKISTYVFVFYTYHFLAFGI